MGNFYTNITLKGPDQYHVLEFLRENSREAFVSKDLNEFVVVFDAKSESQDDKVFRQAALSLSSKFCCPALAVLNHDDDVLCYWLFESGKETDSYNSNPGYFTGKPLPPSGGNIRSLIDAFGCECEPASAEEILRPPRSTSQDTLEKMQEEMQKYMNEIEPELRKNPTLFQDPKNPITIRINEFSQKVGQIMASGNVAKNFVFAVMKHEALLNTLGFPDCAAGMGYNSLQKGEFPSPLSKLDFQHT